MSEWNGEKNEILNECVKDNLKFVSEDDGEEKNDDDD